MREPVALLTPRPSLRVPRREMIGEPSPATSSKLTAYPPARLHSQDTSGAGAVGMEPRSRGGGVSVNPSRHHGHWLRGRTPSFAIGVVCRSGKRRRAHELVSRHPNMLGICVGRNGLMIGIPKELLEKNPGSSSSALLQGFVDPGSASWGWRADGLRSGWLGQHVWSMCTRTHLTLCAREDNLWWATRRYCIS